MTRLEVIRKVSDRLHDVFVIDNTVEYPGYICVEGGSRNFHYGTVNGVWEEQAIDRWTLEPVGRCVKSDIDGESEEVERIAAWVHAQCLEGE